MPPGDVVVSIWWKDGRLQRAELLTGGDFAAWVCYKEVRILVETTKAERVCLEGTRVAVRRTVKE